ncbi:MAG: T9SS type B sorting domain-containing protein [Bacteroidia bacterium]
MQTLRLKYFATVFFSVLIFGGFGQGGGTTSGGTSFCSTTNTGFISCTTSSTTYTIQYWESSTNGGVTWTNIGNPTATQSFFNLTQTTCYRVIVKKPSLAFDTSTVSCVTILAPTVAGTVSGGGSFCGSTGAGTLTLSGNTGNVTQWQSSTDGGATWSVITNTTTTLTYTNITQNTLYGAVVQNGSVCATQTTSPTAFTIDSVSQAGTISIIGNDTNCYGTGSGTLNLSGNTGQVTSWIYSNNSGLTWTAITNTTTVQSFSSLTQNTIYGAIVKSGMCPADTSSRSTITVLPLPTVNAGTDTSIVIGQTVTLNGIGAGTPLWTPSSTLNNATIFSPIATPTSTTPYILVITGLNGCVNSDTVVVTVTSAVFNGTISNYFTPNGDNINDSWYIQDIVNYPDNEVFVYNIYGQQVYNKKPYANDWKGTCNGSELPDGTYYYVLKFNNSGKVLKGSVDIMSKK